jgi:hypothetical protein
MGICNEKKSRLKMNIMAIRECPGGIHGLVWLSNPTVTAV